MKQFRHDSLALLFTLAVNVQFLVQWQHWNIRLLEWTLILGVYGDRDHRQSKKTCHAKPCHVSILFNTVFSSSIRIAISTCVERPNILFLFSELSLVVCRYEVLSISIYYRFPLCPFCAANIFGQRERRRDQSHVWSQDILESLASESSFHHHLSHTASVNIVIDIHCPRSGQMC